MKIRFCAALLLAALTLFSGCAANVAAPAPTPSVLTATEEPIIPLPPVSPTEAPTLPTSASKQPQQITREEAISIALQDAGFAESHVTRLKAEFDYDSSRTVYEVEFHHDGWEYDYEIHSETGKILHKDKDLDD